MAKMVQIECSVCKRSPADGTTLYPISPKGPGRVWRCSGHYPSDMRVDPEVQNITQIISKIDER